MNGRIGRRNSPKAAALAPHTLKSASPVPSLNGRLEGFALLRLTDLGLTCACNMITGGRELQGERPSTHQAYRVRSKPVLGRAPADANCARLQNRRITSVELARVFRYAARWSVMAGPPHSSQKTATESRRPSNSKNSPSSKPSLMMTWSVSRTS